CLFSASAQSQLERAGHTATVPAEAQEQLEQGLTLQGAAAIQDDLVKDVCLSVRRLQAAGIRFWILTGDKPDTAEAIALAAGVADPTTPFLRLTRSQLQRNASQDVIASSSPSQLPMVTSSPSDLLAAALDADTSSASLLLDDFALDLALGGADEALQTRLLDRLCDAKAVVLARMRKDQKQAVARQLKAFGRKRAQRVHVLCVGDGANDIGMIRESDIGVGIKGKEGLQAFNNCDANEMRLQTLVLFFLYKNTLLSVVTLLLSYTTMFSGLKVLPSWGVDGYNTYFTSVPIITLASVDFICSKEVMARVPQLYAVSWFKPRLSRLSFLCNILLSIVESLVILGLCFLFFPYSSACDVGMNMTISTSFLGCVVFTIMVIIANVRILFISCLHYRLLVFFILCSILLWFATFAVIAGFVLFPAENPDLYGSFFGLFTNCNSLLVILFFVVVFALRPFVWEAVRCAFSPSPSQIVSEMNEIEYQKATSKKWNVYGGYEIAFRSEAGGPDSEAAGEHRRGGIAQAASSCSHSVLL
ncbi:hypothetical protein BLSTO_04950, partial [Blastocystis sp. subtype 1]